LPFPAPARGGGSDGSGNVYADSAAAEWGGFRGAENGYTHGLTPRAAREVTEKWLRSFPRTDPWYAVSAPIIAEGSIFVAVSNKLYKLDTNGNIKGQADLKSRNGAAAPVSATIGYVSFIAYGDGKVFVPLKGGDIQAFNAKTMKSLWIADYNTATAYPKKYVKQPGIKAQIMPAASAAAITPAPGVSITDPDYRAESQLLYKDGYLYTGVYYYLNNTETYGTFFAIDATDGDTSNDYEHKGFAWEFDEPAGKLKGYYWAGVAAAGDYVLFAGDAGVIYAIDAEPVSTSTIRASVSISALAGTGVGALCRAGMLFSGSDSTVFITTKNISQDKGRVWAVPFNKTTGSFATPKTSALSGGPGASIPVVYGSKLYALSGFINGGGKLDVFDKSNLTKKASLDFGGYSQSSPLVSDAYAGKIYLYVALNEQAGDQVVVIEDGVSSASRPRASVLYKPGGNQSLNSIIADRAGNIYFADGKGRLVSLASKRLDYDPVDAPRRINLHATGGSLSAKSIEAINGKPLPAVPAPTRRGYSFKGWYLDASYKKAYQAGKTAALSDDTTIYARWEANRYTVNFNVNGGKKLAKSKASKAVSFDSAIGALPLPKASKSKYGFAGWFTAKKGGLRVTSDTKVDFTAAKTYYAHWGKKYTVKFNAAGGKVSKKKMTVVKGSLYGKFPKPSRKGYSFKGWYTKKSGGKKIESGQTVTIKKTSTFYAHWSKKK
jgi:uncharacterized repeat protein (TIGR02543 family)